MRALRRRPATTNWPGTVIHLSNATRAREWAGIIGVGRTASGIQPRTFGEEATVADVNKVRRKVQQLLLQGTGSVSVDEDNDFCLQVDSSQVFIRVMPHPNGEAVLVVCFSQILHDVPPSPEFFKYVATSDEYVFGALTAAEQPDGNYLLIMRQTLLGDSLAEDALLYSAFGVLAAANELDQQLASQFGGKTFRDE